MAKLAGDLVDLVCATVDLLPETSDKASSVFDDLTKIVRSSNFKAIEEIDSNPYNISGRDRLIKICTKHCHTLKAQNELLTEVFNCCGATAFEQIDVALSAGRWPKPKYLVYPDDAPINVQLRIISHELGHVVTGHPMSIVFPESFLKVWRNLQEQMADAKKSEGFIRSEFIAESISYLVCKNLFNYNTVVEASAYLGLLFINQPNRLVDTLQLDGNMVIEKVESIIEEFQNV